MRTIILSTVSTVLALFCIAGSLLANSEYYLQDQILDHPATGKVRIGVPSGYQLEILNADLRRPRMIEFAPNGDMFIGSASRIYLLKPPYTAALEFLKLENYPHSVAIRGDEMFVATTAALYKAPYHPESQRITLIQLKLVTRLPGGIGHNSRTVAVGPDNLVYVSLGISRNCSDQLISRDYPFKDRRGGVLQLDESQNPPVLVPFASGLRNPVGFDWHPTSKVMYATNNGPDHLGFDLPPEYFSKLTPGSFHGMPWFQYDGQAVLRDPCIRTDSPYPKEKVQIPVATFPARNAPLGMAFVAAGEMDERFANNAIVALHGSWGTQPNGAFTGPASSRRPPAVVMVRFNHQEAVDIEPVITGFQDEDGKRWARPAGVALGPDGGLYVTSDGGEFQGLMRLRLLDDS